MFGGTSHNNRNAVSKLLEINRSMASAVVQSLFSHLGGFRRIRIFRRPFQSTSDLLDRLSLSCRYISANSLDRLGGGSSSLKFASIRSKLSFSLSDLCLPPFS